MSFIGKNMMSAEMIWRGWAKATSASATGNEGILNKPGLVTITRLSGCGDDFNMITVCSADSRNKVQVRYAYGDVISENGGFIVKTHDGEIQFAGAADEISVKDKRFLAVFSIQTGCSVGAKIWDADREEAL